jgi:hypothetical protein
MERINSTLHSRLLVEIGVGGSVFRDVAINPVAPDVVFVQHRCLDGELIVYAVG